MLKIPGDHAFPRARAIRSLVAVAMSFGLAFAASGGCAGAISQDMPPEISGGMDASTDAPTDASTDAPTAYNGPIGNPCAANADCGAGYRCQLTVPGGYCIMDCGDGTPCPQGTLCSPIPMTRVVGACMKACASQAECRPGYDCAIVYLFEGSPGAPASPAPVCWEPGLKDAGP